MKDGETSCSVVWPPAMCPLAYKQTFPHMPENILGHTHTHHKGRRGSSWQEEGYQEEWQVVKGNRRGWVEGEHGWKCCNKNLWLCTINTCSYKYFLKEGQRHVAPGGETSNPKQTYALLWPPSMKRRAVCWGTDGMSGWTRIGLTVRVVWGIHQRRLLRQEFKSIKSLY